MLSLADELGQATLPNLQIFHSESLLGRYSEITRVLIFSQLLPRGGTDLMELSASDSSWRTPPATAWWYRPHAAQRE